MYPWPGAFSHRDVACEWVGSGKRVEAEAQIQKEWLE